MWHEMTGWFVAQGSMGRLPRLYIEVPQPEGVEVRLRPNAPLGDDEFDRLVALGRCEQVGAVDG